MDKSIKISAVLLVIVVSLILYFDKLYVINNYEDLKDTLKELDAYPYKDEEIFKVSEDEDRIYVLYKNKAFDGYYIVRTFKKNAIFKNRYEEEFIKDNEKLDFKLHHTDIDTKDCPIGLIHGVDVKSDKFYTTLITGSENGHSKVKIDKYNNISGNFIDIIKVDKNFDLFLHEFDSEVEQNKFIEQRSKGKEGI